MTGQGQHGGEEPNYGYDSGAWEAPRYPSYFPQPGAPFGYDPATGVPYSAKSRLGVGLLNILVAGVGRMYAGQVGLGVGQLLVALMTCGVGWIWSLVDGILILVNGGRDEEGRPLRP